jgi:elongation factor Tu
MLAKDHGGRHTPVFDGYRPRFSADGTDLGVAVVRLPAENPVLVPGTEVDVELEPVDASLWAAVETGQTLGVFEDDHGQIGNARVLPA